MSIEVIQLIIALCADNTLAYPATSFYQPKCVYEVSRADPSTTAAATERFRLVSECWKNSEEPDHKIGYGHSDKIYEKCLEKGTKAAPSGHHDFIVISPIVPAGSKK